MNREILVSREAEEAERAEAVLLDTLPGAEAEEAERVAEVNAVDPPAPSEEAEDAERVAQILGAADLLEAADEPDPRAVAR